MNPARRGVHQGWAPPEAERLGQPVERLLRELPVRELGAVGGQSGESRDVESGVVDREAVSRGALDHDVGLPEHPAQPGDQRLEGVGRIGRRLVAPHGVDQCSRRHRSAAGGREPDQQHPESQSGNRYRDAVEDHLERAQHVHLQDSRHGAQPVTGCEVRHTASPNHAEQTSAKGGLISDSVPLALDWVRGGNLPGSTAQRGAVDGGAQGDHGAVSGLIMIGYLLAHMYGNLKVFAGQQAFDDYAHHLRIIGEPMLPYAGLLWIIRVVLLVSVLAHIFAAVSLWRRDRRARGGTKRYYSNKARRGVQRSYASFTLRWGGLIIALVRRLPPAAPDRERGRARRAPPTARTSGWSTASRSGGWC